jgi:hypothetical protein
MEESEFYKAALEAMGRINEALKSLDDPNALAVPPAAAVMALLSAAAMIADKEMKIAGGPAFVKLARETWDLHAKAHRRG